MERDPAALSPGMTVLEVLSRHPETEAIFRRYEQELGECLLCHDLFHTLEEVAARYGLDLEKLLNDLAAGENPPGKP